MTDDEAIAAVRAALDELNSALDGLPSAGIAVEIGTVDIARCDSPNGLAATIITAHLTHTKTEIDVRL